MTDQNQVIEKARQFALTRFSGETDAIIREHQQKLINARAKLASQQGLGVSRAMTIEAARINADQIKALTLARLDAILDGYELYGVVIDDTMAVNICDEVVQLMNFAIRSAQNASIAGAPAGSEYLYPQFWAKAVGVNAAMVKTLIDRRRLMPKK